MGQEKVTTAKERVEIEKAELSERLDKLKVYIDSNPHFKMLGEVMQALLKEQCGHMRAYLGCLQNRLDIWDI